MKGSNLQRKNLLSRRAVIALILLIAVVGALSVQYAMNSAVNSMAYVTAALTTGTSLSRSNLPVGSVVTLDSDTVAFVSSVERLSARGSASTSEEVLLYHGTWAADGQKLASQSQLVAVMAESEAADAVIRIRLVPAESMPRVSSPRGLRLDPGPALMPLYIQR